MSIVTFYLLEGGVSSCDNNPSQTALDNAVMSVMAFHVLQRAKIYLYCEDKLQAEYFDEKLWQLPPEHFIPHQLVGEATNASCQVEIGWQGLQRPSYRHLLINLSTQSPIFAPSFAQVIDFVPCDDTLKQKARERYQIYRQAGHQMQTASVDSLSHS